MKICIATCLDMCIDTCLDMCIDTCIDTCLDMCIDMCIVMSQDGDFLQYEDGPIEQGTWSPPDHSFCTGLWTDGDSGHSRSLDTVSLPNESLPLHIYEPRDGQVFRAGVPIALRGVYVSTVNTEPGQIVLKCSKLMSTRMAMHMSVRMSVHMSRHRLSGSDWNWTTRLERGRAAIARFRSVLGVLPVGIDE